MAEPYGFGPSPAQGVPPEAYANAFREFMARAQQADQGRAEADRLALGLQPVNAPMDPQGLTFQDALIMGGALPPYMLPNTGPGNLPEGTAFSPRQQADVLLRKFNAAVPAQQLPGGGYVDPYTGQTVLPTPQPEPGVLGQLQASMGGALPEVAQTILRYIQEWNRQREAKGGTGPSFEEIISRTPVVNPDALMMDEKALEERKNAFKKSLSGGK